MHNILRVFLVPKSHKSRLVRALLHPSESDSHPSVGLVIYMARWSLTNEQDTIEKRISFKGLEKRRWEDRTR